MTDFALARIALLSVAEAEELLRRDDEGGDLIRTAIDLAWGSPSGRPDPQPRPHDTTMRYIARMGGRATPFGLLAGTRHTAVGPERELVLGSRDKHRALVRVDFEVLQRLVTDAVDAADPDRRPLRRNRTLRRHAGGLRYMKAGDVSADLVSVRATPAIEAILEVIGDKAMPAGELLDALTERFPGTARESLRAFVDRTVASELLTTAADLVRPGDEPAELALAVLDRVGDRPRAEALAAVGAVLRDEHRIDPGLMDRLETAWQPLLAAAPALADIPPNRRFHLDMEMRLDASVLDRRTVDDMIAVVRRLERLFGPTPYLVDFRTAFRRRYEDAEVPLLEALDPETGVIQAAERAVSPLAAQGEVVGRGGGRHTADVPTELLRLYGEWADRGGEIDISELPQVRRSTVRGLLGSLVDDHEGRFDSMLTAGYQRTSLALIARFVVGREGLTEAVRAWSDAGGVPADDDPAAPLHAELVYSPGGRVSNALLRPRVFRHEVALDGGGDGTLTLDRLRLRLDGDELRLRDCVTGRDVILEMNSSHNVSAAGLDPIYMFLGMMVSPGAIGWSWGHLSSQSHLPRVVCGRVIVAPETWTLPGSAVREVLASADPPFALRRLLRGLGSRRYVGVGEDDRVLAVDVDSARSIELALTRMAKDDRIQFTELPHVESPAVIGPTGRHVCEITVPLRREATLPQPTLPVAPYDPEAGPSWAYAKLYCGPSTADAVLRTVAQQADELQASGLIDEWFFLRYADDGYHLRVRMRPVTPDRRPSVLVALDACAAALRRQGLVTRVATDDYVPEVARYGGTDALRRAESLFAADSAAVARFLVGNPSEQTRLYQCVADVIAWAEVLYPGLDDQHELLRRCHSGLGLAYGATRNVRGRFFRRHRQELDDHLATATADSRSLERLAELAAVVRDRDTGSVPLRVAAAVLHMHCNRQFMVDARRLEFLAYDLADRKVLERRARTGSRGTVEPAR